MPLALWSVGLYHVLSREHHRGDWAAMRHLLRIVNKRSDVWPLFVFSSSFFFFFLGGGGGFVWLLF